MAIDKKSLHTALLSAYPHYDGLAQLLDFESDVQLSPNTRNQSDVVYAVIKDAEAKGWTTRLVTAGSAARPNNADLADLVRSANAPVSTPANATAPAQTALSGGANVSGGHGIQVGSNNQQFNIHVHINPAENTTPSNPDGVATKLNVGATKKHPSIPDVEIELPTS